MKYWIQTYSGVAVNLLEPTVEMIRWGDIAHSLAQQCRYNGHTPRIYSVAEHSIVVHNLVQRGLSRFPGSIIASADKKLLLCALLHDAAEAYVGDIVHPLKRAILESDESLHQIENGILARIFEKAGIVHSNSWAEALPSVIADADMRALSIEFDQFFWARCPQQWDFQKNEVGKCLHVENLPGFDEEFDPEAVFTYLLRNLL